MTCTDTDNTLKITQGASKTQNLFVRQADTGLAQDLTLSTVFFTLKERFEDIEPLIAKVSTDTTQISITSPQLTSGLPNANTGRATIFLLPGDTANLVAGATYWVDVWILLPNGEHRPVICKRPCFIDFRVTNIDL